MAIPLLQPIHAVAQQQLPGFEADHDGDQLAGAENQHELAKGDGPQSAGRQSQIDQAEDGPDRFAAKHPTRIVKDAAPLAGAMRLGGRETPLGGILCLGANEDQSRCVVVRLCGTHRA